MSDDHHDFPFHSLAHIFRALFFRSCNTKKGNNDKCHDVNCIDLGLKEKKKKPLSHNNNSQTILSWINYRRYRTFIGFSSNKISDFGWINKIKHFFRNSHESRKGLGRTFLINTIKFIIHSPTAICKIEMYIQLFTDWIIVFWSDRLLLWVDF